MPRAPTAKSRGRGAGPAAPKAAPIARPSSDYQWKIDHRAYGTGEEKERREELRRQEAETRQQARELGEEVDIGRDADYWRKIAESNQRAPVYRSQVSDDRRWPKQGNTWWASPDHGHKARVGIGRGWSSSAVSNSDKAWDTHADSAASHWQHDDRWEKSSHEGSVAGTSHGRERSQKDWGTPPSASSSPSMAWSGYTPVATPRWHTEAPSSKALRSFTAESKAQREELRKREADARRLALEENQALRTGVPSAQLLPLQFDFADMGVDSEGLQRIMTEVEQRLLRREREAHVQVIDLSGNNLKDDDVAKLVSFLQAQGITSEELCLQGNPLENPQSLIELLGDSRVGLAGGLRELRLSTDISKECCWRICEKANRIQPQPPLRFILIGRSTQDFEMVFRMAVVKYKAKVSGFAGGVSEDEAFLAVQFLEEEGATGSSDKEFAYQ